MTRAILAYAQQLNVPYVKAERLVMSAEQTKLDWNQLIEIALTAEGSVGNVYNRFHEYSLTNNFLFMMQGIHEPVASFARWKSLGRHVRRGARAKEVIVPVLVNEPARERDGDGDEDRDRLEAQRERVARLIGFKVVRAVFALSDTEGAELPPIQLPSWDMQTALDTLGIRQVPFDELNGNIQGYSRGREIALNPVAVHPAKTLMHELGHVVLGHTVATTLGEYATHRGVMEFQAEATAYLTMHELGQLTDEIAAQSRGYVQHWLHNERPGEREIRLVFAATDQILRAGRLAAGQVISADAER